MLCHYNDNIVPKVSSSITYNNENNLLSPGNLSMSYVEMKEIMFHGFEWNYNDIDVEITWRCQIGE
jgi:hypothetical protein